MARKRGDLMVTVSGIGSFPLDMLRYDGLEFLSQYDERIASRTYERSVDVVKKEAPFRWYPTVKRWESFGWRVIAVRHR